MKDDEEFSSDDQYTAWLLQEYDKEKRAQLAAEEATEHKAARYEH